MFLACSREQSSATHDDLNRAIALPKKITRIVTLAPNVTEMLFACGAGELVVATDDNSNFPAAVRRLPKVGAMQPNIERVVSMRPDVVFASSEGNLPVIEAPLAAAHVPLYVVRTDRLQEIAPAMQRLGALVRAPRTAEAVRELQRAIDAQRRTRARPPRILFAVWTDPLYVAGANTFTADLYALTGAQNAVQVRGWPQYSLETLAAHPPDLLLYPRRSVSAQQVSALLARVPNVRPRVVAVDEDLFQRPGPRVGEAARALNEILDRP
ncbi:MAG TPA: helical backbone metal receptor [Thermoanaerobaculia bacterium]